MTATNGHPLYRLIIVTRVAPPHIMERLTTTQIGNLTIRELANPMRPDDEIVCVAITPMETEHA